MKRFISIAMVAAAVLCGCQKENLIPQETTEGQNEVHALTFTATVEGAPETKATFDDTYKCAAWEVGDQVNINGTVFQANTAGTSTTFKSNSATEEIRPSYVSTTTPGHWGDLDASKLVDDSGAQLEWCTPTSAKAAGVWNIVVTTGDPTVLKTIKLWNARNTVTNYGRTWKKVKVYGSNTANGPWGDPIGDFDNLDLAINNYEFAGELEINATEAYTFYKIDVLENKGGTGDDYMQMADMKFVVTHSIAAPYNAYFPASLYNGTAAVLPANITETWAEGKFNMPMYAHSENTNLQFKNLCGVLKIIVKSDRISEVKSIRVRSANKAISGEFEIKDGNAAVLADSVNVANTLTVTYTETVSTTEDGTVFYVAIPAQTYRELKIELSSDGENFTKSITTRPDTDIKVTRNKIYPVNHVYSIPSDAIPFEFTVNDEGKKVYFSKGNLQATFLGGDATNYSWGFAEHQYDFIGNAAGNTTIDSQTAGAVVDLFGWSTGSTYYGISTYSSPIYYSGEFIDWGTAIDDEGTWRTLTKEEWDYLLNTRSTSRVSSTDNARFVKASISGMTGSLNGLILFPDNYSNPVRRWESINSKDAMYGANTIDYQIEWLELQADGCIFIPCAGLLRSGSAVLSYSYAGAYWSSTPENDFTVYCLHLNLDKLEMSGRNAKPDGHSVRLVTDVK